MTKQSNVGKKWNCKNEIVKMKFSFFLRNEIKTHFFCKQKYRNQSRKKKQKKVKIHYQSSFKIEKLSKRRVSEDTFTVSPWPSCSAASAICLFVFWEACPLTLGDNIMPNEVWRNNMVLIKKQDASILSDVKKKHLAKI